MASITKPPTAPTQLHDIKSPSFQKLSRSNLSKSVPYYGVPRVRAVKIAHDGGSGRVGSGTDQAVYSPDLLKQPVLVSLPDDGKEYERDDDGSQPQGVDWEDQILCDTAPLVGFARMILHSGKYKNGDRLSPVHEKIIMEKLLPYHPKYEQKVGFGIDHIKVGYHPEFEGTRCLLIVQKGGELVDFSYWKCVKGLIRKKYPLYADSFFLRHFRRHWRRE